MALERFKKQVLLLHSERRTLDTLSAGFNDGYTVHCATSGSEALNTLGETDIDVIVTAQDLPGMSGLDALREAKKRSPETIGILLAGNDGEDVEALVGDQEVFQVVRGGVTPESLRRMIDDATRQSRLMALAESANDTKANMDSTSEHIVMETAENGSAIVSDGTGRMPALNPDKVAAEPHVGARAVDVLVLTRDEEFLGTVRESARGMHNVIFANTLAQAEEAITHNKVGVAVIDAAMVGDNVEKLTLHLRGKARRLVAIVAGRRDDGEMLMGLINRGKVYRFLLKPVSPGRARLAIEASVKHHLEAPDSAFKAIGAAQAAPMPTREKAKPAAKSAPVAAAKPRPAAAATKPAKAEAARPVPRIVVEPRSLPGDSSDMMNDALSDAFTNDSSFTETMAGIVRSFGEKFSPSAKKEKTREAPALPAAAAKKPEPATPAVTPPVRKARPDKPKADASTVNKTQAARKPAIKADPERFRTPRPASYGFARSRPKLALAGIVTLVAVLAVGWWMFDGSGNPEPGEGLADDDTGMTGPRDASRDPSGMPRTVGIQDLLEEARLAAAAGQVYSPSGSNAIELFAAAVEAAPGNAAIAAELDAVIEQALSMAESSLLQRNSGAAAVALQRVATVDPDHARLPFLEAQLAQLQLRDYVDTARHAIRDSRFEDAEAALDAARKLSVQDRSEIELVAEELNTSQSKQRVDDVLAKANARLEEGLLTAPSNNNARYYYELALSIDAGNAAATQGLLVIASKLVFQAGVEIDAGRFDAAEILLADARRLAPDSEEVTTSTAALEEARSIASQDRAATLQPAGERKAGANSTAKKSLDESVDDTAAKVEQPAEGTAAEAAANEEQPPAKELLADASSREAAKDNAESADTAGRQLASAQLSDEDSRPVAVSLLNRTRYVAPRYPRSAQRRNITGWVEVIFSVDVDGSVKNISIVAREPDDTFDDAAVSAIERWEFEPIIEDGIAVEKRAMVRMMFELR